MSKIIAVHSYKGGTGKTLFSVNLAATFAKAGKKVCVFDLDFRAPSLFAILKTPNADFWLNDYLNNTCEIEQDPHKLKQPNPWRRKILCMP
jgi:septum site-determining protein MinD